MKVLCVHETPILSGDRLNLIAVTARALGVESFEIMPLGKQGTKFKPEDWQAMHDEVLNASQEFDRVLCLGGIALSAAFNTEKACLISKHRGRGMLLDTGVYCVPTWAPMTVLKEPDFFRDFMDDFHKLVNNDTPMPTPKVETVVVTKDNIAEELYYLGEASFLACDIETTGFNVVTKDLLTIGFCALHPDNSGRIVIVPQYLLKNKAVRKFLESYDGMMVFHNVKFDLQFLQKQYPGLRFKNVTDTMLLHYAGDERPANKFAGIHSLKGLARVHYDAPDYDIDMGEWLNRWEDATPAGKRALLGELYPYQTFDCYYTARLYEDLSRDLLDESPKLLDLVRDVLVPASIALAEIESYGVRVNRPYLEEMNADVAVRLADDLTHIRAFVAEHSDNEEFNPNSPKQVETLLYDDLGLPVLHRAGRSAYKRDASKRPTNKDVLKALAKQIRPTKPAIADLITTLLDYRVRSKILGTYVVGMLDRLDPDDRIRADFFVPGTATGRLSCSNPNLQNIPDASHVGYDIREAFIASEGLELIEADYSQLELRVAALFSQDPELIQTYIDGRDIHQEVAFRLWNKPKEQVTKYERYLAKCLNFGLLYQRGPRSIATGPEMDHLAEMSGGKAWSPKQIEEYFKTFLAGYPQLVEWIEQQKVLVKQRRYTETPFGRRRRFPFIPRDDKGHTERQGVNTPIQSFASDLCLTALTRVHERLRRDFKGDAHILFTVHDSILLEVRPHRRDEVVRVILEEMRDNLPPVTEYNLPFEAEVAFGVTWGSCKEHEEVAPIS